MKKVTIKQVADKAGVSTACVSMILNGRNLSRFSAETVQNVNSASQELGYVLKRRSPHRTQRQLILIICPSMMNPYYATLVQSMEQEARLRGFSSLIYTTYWDKDAEREALELAKEKMVAGVIFAMIPQQPPLAEEASLQVPMVTVGDRSIDIKIDTVDVNNYEAGRMMASHLIGMGHKHIAYLSTTLNEEHSSRMKRCMGLQDEYHQSCPSGSVTVFSEDVSSEQELHVIDVEHEVGYSLAKRCLDESPEVTAMVAINDMVAYGVREALIDEGRRIPEDISLCGFDNIYPSRFHGMELTTVEHAIVERGRSSIQLLAEKMEKQPFEAQSGTIHRLEYQNRLVVGGSSGAARAV